MCHLICRMLDPLDRRFIFCMPLLPACLPLPWVCAPMIPAWSHQSFSKEDNFAHCTDGCFLSMARRRQIHILVQHYHSHADPGAPPFQSSEHMTHSSLDVEFRIRRQQLTNIRTCMLCCLNDITSSCT